MSARQTGAIHPGRVFGRRYAKLAVISAATLLLLAGTAVPAAELPVNLIKNGSFEEGKENNGLPVFWNDGGYSPGKRTDEKASDGKYSVCFVGDGKSNMALSQTLKLDEALRECGAKLEDAKLEVSCDVYVESFTQGAIRPIHFIIVDANGKAHYVQERMAEMKINQWIMVKCAIDLSQYAGMKGITFFVLGFSDGKQFFVGKFYVDNVKIILCRNKGAPQEF